MKILITGTRGIAKALASVYNDHHPVMVSRSTGHDINSIHQWGDQFLSFDMIFNCAYDGFAQVKVLEYFYAHWQHRAEKTLVNIGSKVITHPRLEQGQDLQYWPYRLHKQTLQLTHDTMAKCAVCRMLLVNPGAVDTDMIAHLNIEKMSPLDLAHKIQHYVTDTAIKRVDLWL